MTSMLLPPVVVGDRLGPERGALLALLADLDAAAWRRPTVCPGWDVHALVLHLLHDDLRRLSAARDGHTGGWIDATGFEQLVAGLDALNEQFVATLAAVVSPRLARELLTAVSPSAEEHLRSLPPDAPDGTVAWAGAGPHPNWLDVAREFTERWVHQQQIRAAVARPGLDGPSWLAPVLDTFVHALPPALPPRPAGTRVLLHVTGPLMRGWSATAAADGWRLAHASIDDAGEAGDPGGADVAAVVVIPASLLWRRAVRMADAHEVRAASRVQGDPALTDAVLDLRAAIVPDA
ncbi:maleylpyruvate isomerase N-terminal domain-containing protein [Egicoccus sp. AB-alg2]|uniref:maleylpyruvate isomerase N-terminal domain-containing protein n=1 Tax=Egicoccus sp. AB-alg2 TaxID=3242693 RepID=UPI00359EBCFE